MGKHVRQINASPAKSLHCSSLVSEEPALPLSPIRNPQSKIRNSFVPHSFLRNQPSPVRFHRAAWRHNHSLLPPPIRFVSFFSRNDPLPLFNPKFEIRNPKFFPRNPKFFPRNPKFEIRNPQFFPRNSKSEIRNSPLPLPRPGRRPHHLLQLPQRRQPVLRHPPALGRRPGLPGAHLPARRPPRLPRRPLDPWLRPVCRPQWMLQPAQRPGKSRLQPTQHPESRL